MRGLGLKKEKEKKDSFEIKLGSMFKARKGSFSSNRLASLMYKKNKKER